DYAGRRPKALQPKARNINDSLSVPFNAAGWKLAINELRLNNGAFKSSRDVQREVYDHFDASRIHFYAINGKFKKVALVQDTLFADISLSPEERSGFTVRSLTSRFTMERGGMIFGSLVIRTPSSYLTHFCAMPYHDCND